MELVTGRTVVPLLVVILGVLAACGGRDQKAEKRDQGAGNGAALRACSLSWNAVDDPDIAGQAKSQIGPSAQQLGNTKALVTLDGRGNCVVAFPEALGTAQPGGDAYAWVRTKGKWDLFPLSLDRQQTNEGGAAQLRAWEEQVATQPNAETLPNGDVDLVRDSAPAPIALGGPDEAQSASGPPRDEEDPGAAPSGADEDPEAVLRNDAIVGVWEGQAIQRAPSGARDRVHVRLEIPMSRGRVIGALEEVINSDHCAGGVKLTNAQGDRFALRYREQRDPEGCVSETRITLVAVSETQLRFGERYDTSGGPGTVTGTLRRTDETPKPCAGDPDPRC